MFNIPGDASHYDRLHEDLFLSRAPRSFLVNCFW